MKYRRRIYYSAAQRAEIWDRWQRGESLSSIGRAFDRQSFSVPSVIFPSSGIRPPDRRRGKQSLSLNEREEVSRNLSAKQSLRAIARQLRRAPSTKSCEFCRNGRCAAYRATGSDQAAWDRALRPKICKLACHPFLSRSVSTNATCPKDWGYLLSSISAVTSLVINELINRPRNAPQIASTLASPTAMPITGWS